MQKGAHNPPNPSDLKALEEALSGIPSAHLAAVQSIVDGLIQDALT